MARESSPARSVLLVLASAFALGVVGFAGAWAGPTAWYEAGVLAYKHEWHRPTRWLLGSFARHFPSDERAQPAVYLMLDDLAATKEWTGLSEELRALKDDPKTAGLLEPGDAPIAVVGPKGTRLVKPAPRR